MQVRCEHVRQGISAGSHLHPKLQHRPCLLPHIFAAPPPFEIVKQGFYAPTPGEQNHDILGAKVGFVGKNEFDGRPYLRGLIPYLAPDRIYRHGVKKAGQSQARLQAHALLFAVNEELRFSDWKVFLTVLRRDPLTILAWRTALPLRPWRWRQIQRRIVPGTPDEAHMTLDKGQNETAPHKPRIKQYANLPGGMCQQGPN